MGIEDTMYGGKYSNNSIKDKFKENWIKTDKRCPHCNNVTEQAKGLNKQNIKKLFKLPSFNDLLMLFIIFMLLIMSWAYNRDISLCRSYIKTQQHSQIDVAGLINLTTTNPQQNFTITLDDIVINDNYEET
jgi:hypothetical protein